MTFLLSAKSLPRSWLAPEPARPYTLPPAFPKWTGVSPMRCSVTGLLTFLLAICFAIPAEAIVRRRLNVNSNPPGALVYVDNQQIGTTPCSVDFTYYGTREI